MPAYIVIDGMDGAGKGTVLSGLQKVYPPHIGNSPGRFWYTREPGGTPVAEKIRSIVVNDQVSALTELLLFVAAREDLREVLIKPALDRGDHIISDRSVSSTFAYQLYGRDNQKMLPTLQHINALHQVQPTVYIFLDLDPEEAARRTCLRSDDGMIVDGAKFDKESLAFHTRARAGFKAFREFFPDTLCHFVDASQPPDKVFEDVLAVIVEHLKVFG